MGEHHLFHAGSSRERGDVLGRQMFFDLVADPVALLSGRLDVLPAGALEHRKDLGCNRDLRHEHVSALCQLENSG